MYNLHFYFQKDLEIETLSIEIRGIAKASLYKYLDDDSTIYLSNLYVNPNLRNRGIGTRLQVIREELGRAINARFVCLLVEKNSWMHDWYVRRGYMDFVNHDNPDFIWMIKSL